VKLMSESRVEIDEAEVRVACGERTRRQSCVWRLDNLTSDSREEKENLMSEPRVETDEPDVRVA